MDQATVAQAMELAQLKSDRAALRAEAVEVGLTNRRLAKIVRCSEQMISGYFLGDAHSKRVGIKIRRAIDKRREKLAKKTGAAA